MHILLLVEVSVAYVEHNRLELHKFADKLLVFNIQVQTGNVGVREIQDKFAPQLLQDFFHLIRSEPEALVLLGKKWYVRAHVEEWNDILYKYLNLVFLAEAFQFLHVLDHPVEQNLSVAFLVVTRM